MLVKAAIRIVNKIVWPSSKQLFLQIPIQTLYDCANLLDPKDST